MKANTKTQESIKLKESIKLLSINWS